MLKPLIGQGISAEHRDFLKTMAFIVVGLIFMCSFSSFRTVYGLAWVNGKVVMTMRQKVFKHLMFMLVSFFDQNSSGKLLSRITYDSEQIAGSSASTLKTIVQEGAYILFLVGTIFYYSWRLSLVLLIIGPVIAVLARIISKRFHDVNRNMQQSMRTMTASAEQMLHGHKVVLSFG